MLVFVKFMQFVTIGLIPFLVYGITSELLAEDKQRADNNDKDRV